MAFIANVARVEKMCRQNEPLKRVYEYMQSAMMGEVRERISSLALNSPNRVELAEGIYAIEQSYETKPYSEAFFESPEGYIDFQLVLSGQERFCIGEKGDFTLRESYNASRDLIIYDPPLEESCSSFLLHKGSLAVFLPYDVHAGGLYAASRSERVFKSVIKVHRSLVNLSL